MIKGIAAVMIVVLPGCSASQIQSQIQRSFTPEPDVVIDLTTVKTQENELNDKGQVESTTHLVGGIPKSYELNTYFDSGELKSKLFLDDKFVKNGQFIVFYKNGNRHRVRYYTDDVITGQSTAWQENGKLLIQSVGATADSDGYAHLYDQKGLLEVTRKYKFGTEEATSEVKYFYRDDDTLKKTYNVVGSSLEGESLYYHGDGKRIKSKDHYTNNVRHGPSISYKKDGTLHIKAYFENGKLHGNMEVVQEDGMHHFRTYVHGVQGNRSETRYESGELYIIENSVNGKVTDRMFYRKDGKVSIDAKFIAGEAHTSTYYSYFDTGELSWVHNNIDGVRTSSTQYYKGGNLATEAEYKDGKAVKGTQYTYEGAASAMTRAHFHNLGLDI